MQLSITHDTCYDYQVGVQCSQHIAYLQPRSTLCQRLLNHHLHIAPAATPVYTTADVWGNARQYFAVERPHHQLRVVAHSLVNTSRPLPAHSQITWEAVRAHLQGPASGPFDAASEFVFASPQAPHHADFARFSHPCFASSPNLLHATRALMQRIHAELQYESQSTHVHTPAQQALAQRKGVCQDFAHIMLACLRSWGLAARYVSGYLLTQPAPGQPRLLGSDASHAWVSVYLPDLPCNDSSARWWDFDPTNARDGWGTPGEDYVTLAWGRDYADISPLRGVVQGGDRHTLRVGVTVSPQNIPE